MVHGGADVLDAGVRVFEVVRLAAAVALVGGVKGEGYEALLGPLAGVPARGLFLDAAGGWTVTIAA
nr:hypothetical protein [Streptomyces hawaiiensis]